MPSIPPEASQLGRLANNGGAYGEKYGLVLFLRLTECLWFPFEPINLDAARQLPYLRKLGPTRTGFSACCSRYGLFAFAKRFRCRASPGAFLVLICARSVWLWQEPIM